MSDGHLMETVETGTRCSRCLRTAAQLKRSSRLCPGLPWFVRGDAPNNLYTQRQLKQRGLRTTGRAVGCVVTEYNDLVLLYNLAETKPRRGESPRQRAGRIAT